MMLRLDWDQRPPAAKSDGELYLRNCQGILGGHVLSQTGDDGGDDDDYDDGQEEEHCNDDYTKLMIILAMTINKANVKI